MRLYKSEKVVKPIEVHRPSLGKRELESVLDCLIEDRLGSGEVTRRFERQFANLFQYRHSLAVNSLTAAGHLSMMGLGMRPGDHLILSAVAPLALLDAGRYLGAEIHLLDLDRRSFHPATESLTACVEQIKARQTAASVNEANEPESTTAIGTGIFFVLDHSYGSPWPLDVAVLREQGVKIIECITALAGVTDATTGDYLGKQGDVALCSLGEFDLITTGNGAMILHSDPRLQKKIGAMRYDNKERKPGQLAWDYRLEDFQAAMGIHQLNRLGEMLERRRKIGRKYMETLRGSKHESFYRDPDHDTYLNYPVLFHRKYDEVERYFKSLQIGVERACLNPLHHQVQAPRLEFPNAERFYHRAVTIPAYPALTANNVERIAASLRGFI
ncbi:MAG: DegT/DnrJ/EryC1/StrS aminotransferase family protein [Leptospiraceae bacterium]|nr:DegT/DnrJ/EryC1/StrS aminotransferase family protein [Leptospiraceae bacterium]